MEEGILKSLPILRDLDEGELTKFLTITRRIRFPKGKIIIKEGEPGDTMYIIADGTVEISKNLVIKMGREEFQDRDKILTKLSAEDHAVFGEVALFEQGKRTATVVARTDCTLLEITRNDFLSWERKTRESVTKSPGTSPSFFVPACARRTKTRSS